MERTSKVLKGSVWGVLMKLVSVGMPFVVRTIIIQKLGQEYAGLNSLFTSVLSVLNLADLGFGNAVIYDMYKPVEEHNVSRVNVLLGFYRKVYYIVGSVILGLGLIATPFIPYITNKDCPADINIYLLYILFLLHTSIGYFFFSYITSLFSAHIRHDIISKITLIYDFAENILIIVLLLLTKNYYWYIIVRTVMVIPKNLTFKLVANKKFPGYKSEGKILKDDRKRITKNVSALWGHKIGNTFMYSIDSIVISAFLGLVAVGKYGNYYMIISAIICFSAVIAQPISGAVGNIIATKSKSDCFVMFKKLQYCWLWLVSWCAICYFCLIQDFVELWLGKDFQFDIWVVLCITIYYWVWQFRTLIINFKDGAGLWKQDWYKPYIGMVLNVVFSILFIIKTGSVLGVLVPTIVIMLVIYFPIEAKVLSKNIFDCKVSSFVVFFIEQIALWLICFAVTAGTAMLVDYLISSALLRLVVKGICCVILPNCLFALLSFKTDEFKFVIEKALQIFKRKRLKK